MKLQYKVWIEFGIFLCAITFLFVGSALYVYGYLSPDEQLLFEHLLSRYLTFIILPFLILYIILGFIVKRVVEAYLLPIDRIAEEGNIINTVNPSHRISITGSKALTRLTEAINRAAERYQELQTNVEKKIAEAKQSLEEEKNTLIALMAEFTSGVVVCNTEGTILLYNHRARYLLAHSSNSTPNHSYIGYSQWIGLGRSIFSVIPKNMIVHALTHIHHKLSRNDAPFTSQFVMTAHDNRLLRIQMIPVLNDEKEMTGFILTVQDITQQVETYNYRDFLIQSLTERLRASLGSIRAAIEMIVEYPNMNAKQKKQFYEIIQKESFSLSEYIDQTAGDYSKHFKTQWPLENMLSSDFLSILQRRVRDILITVEDAEEELWINVDSYAFVQACYFIIHEIRKNLDVQEFMLRTGRDKQFVYIDICWKFRPFPQKLLNSWKEQLLLIAGEGIPFTLKDVLERHDTEIWSQNDSKSHCYYLRLLLPEIVPPEEIYQPRVAVETPLTLYDFDLFHQAGQTEALDKQPLRQLTYTVFDTETTGLNPSEGDEIISIGAVRIVNGRLLREEVFDQLVNPGRPLTRESSKIHGIEPEMLKGQPSIEEVLPMFHRFAEGTILVAHNAAFDMRFLQMKETALGITFDNPILDTLLLSAVVHPNQEKHHLEAIARRLGIPIIGRHTALGDALVTAEILLKLIPLLELKGIRTLKDAREASQKTYYARLAY